MPRLKRSGSRRAARPLRVRREVWRERITAWALALVVLAVLWALAVRIEMTGVQQRQGRVLTELAMQRVRLPASAPSRAGARRTEMAPAHPAVSATRREQLETVLEGAAGQRIVPEESVVPARRAVPGGSALELLLGDDLGGRPRPERPGSRDLGLPAPGRLPVGRRSVKDGGPDGSLELDGRVPAGPPPGERVYPLDGDATVRPRRREARAEWPLTEREELPAVGEARALDPDELIRWMQLRPGVLPPGIRRHVDWQPGDLAATTMTAHDGAAYELYLMARLPIREIHVVLVSGRQTYYLIDRSFLQDGRKFRVGTARRGGRGDGAAITGVVSQERAAASPEAARFYDIFLAWWQRQRLQL